MNDEQVCPMIKLFPDGNRHNLVACWSSPKADCRLANSCGLSRGKVPVLFLPNRRDTYCGHNTVCPYCSQVQQPLTTQKW